MGRKNKKFSLSRILIIACMIGFVTFLWRSYGYNQSDRAQTAIPVIRADVSPIKEIPTHPGGMEIPFRDSTIFETLETADNDDKPQVENLLAEPRGLKAKTHMQALSETEATPDIDSNAAQDTAAQTPPEPSIDSIIDNLAEAEDNDTQDTNSNSINTDQQSTPLPQGKPSQRPVAATEHPAAQITKIAPAATQASTKVQTGDIADFYVQLGSLSSAQAAQNAWEGFRSEFPSSLQNLSLHIEKADLGPRGTYYRVQAGPLTETKARAICLKISAKRKGGCLVTKIR